MREKAANFAVVYATQWVVYGVTQHETIRDQGRLSNLVKYPTQARFDNDDFHYNLIKHSISGHYYFLFYRSRGYDRKEAFIGAFASSLAFEFAVETLTERPSYQDIYQTPVFGTLLGVGVEHASEYLRASSSAFLKGLGYVLNPFVLLPGPLKTVTLVPSLMPHRPGVLLAVEF